MVKVPARSILPMIAFRDALCITLNPVDGTVSQRREGPAQFAGGRITMRTPVGIIRKAALWNLCRARHNFQDFAFGIKSSVRPERFGALHRSSRLSNLTEPAPAAAGKRIARNSGREGQAMQPSTEPGTRPGLHSNILPFDLRICLAQKLPGDPNQLALNRFGSLTSSTRRDAAGGAKPFAFDVALVLDRIADR